MNLIINNTSATLIATNPVFVAGQIIHETDVNRYKIADGVSSYINLTYQEWGYEVIEAAGTDTYTGSFNNPLFLSLFEMQRFRVRFVNANTTAATLNINGTGAIAIKKNVTAALITNDITAGGIYELIYDGTNFQIGNFIGEKTGNYLPTLFNTTNVQASTAYKSFYYKHDNQISVWGRVDVDVITTSVQTVLGMTLPIASAFTWAQDLAGGAILISNVSGMNLFGLYADIVNARIIFIGRPVTIGNVAYSFWFSYIII
ncbi:MAG: hypothetical protein AABW88_01015 [Nanoarchaeota archaeon]